VRIGDAVGACASLLPGEQLGQDHTERSVQSLAVPVEWDPHSTRQQQYPLPIGHDGKYAVDEIGRGVCHSTTRSRRAESAGFARDATMGSSAHVSHRNADEAVAQEATGEKLLELALDESRIAELVGDIRQRAGSGSAHGQALHFRLMRDSVWTTWIGGVVGHRGVRAPLTGAITLMQWSACPRVEPWGEKAEAESTNGCVPTSSHRDLVPTSVPTFPLRCETPGHASKRLTCRNL